MRQWLAAVPAEDAINWLSIWTFPGPGLWRGDVGGDCVLQPFWTTILHTQIRQRSETTPNVNHNNTGLATALNKPNVFKEILQSTQTESGKSCGSELFVL